VSGPAFRSAAVSRACSEVGRPDTSTPSAPAIPSGALRQLINGDDPVVEHERQVLGALKRLGPAGLGGAALRELAGEGCERLLPGRSEIEQDGRVAAGSLWARALVTSAFVSAAGASVNHP
jgi:hypothetical protein